MSELPTAETHAPAQHKESGSVKRMIPAAAFSLWWIGLLFVAAGRLDWIRGWISVALSVVGITAVRVIVQHYNAPLLEARAKWHHKDTKFFDKSPACGLLASDLHSASDRWTGRWAIPLDLDAVCFCICRYDPLRSGAISDYVGYDRQPICRDERPHSDRPRTHGGHLRPVSHGSPSHVRRRNFDVSIDPADLGIRVGAGAWRFDHDPFHLAHWPGRSDPSPGTGRL